MPRCTAITENLPDLRRQLMADIWRLFEGSYPLPIPLIPSRFPAVYRLLREFGEKGHPNRPENGNFGKRESRFITPNG